MASMYYKKINSSSDPWDREEERLLESFDKKLNVNSRAWCCRGCGALPLPRWSVIVALILLFLAALLSCTWFIILPAIVEGTIHGSTLKFTHIGISDATADSFWLNATGELTHSGSFECTIEAFEITVEYEGRKMGTMNMPLIHAKGKDITHLELGSTFQISDVAVYNDFSDHLLQSKDSSTQWTLKGTTTVKVGGLSLKAKFDKNVGIEGMDGLSNITVLSFDLPKDYPEGGVELLLNVTQYNPSVLSVDIGTITLGVSYQDTYMGQVQASNFTLHPGANLLQFSGFIMPTNVTAAGEFISNYINGRPSAMVVHGLNAGNSSADWLQHMVQSLHISTVLAGAQNLTLLSDLVLETLDMYFESNTAIYAGSTFKGKFQAPFTFPLEVVQAEVNLQMLINDTVFAELQSPFNPAMSNETVDEVWGSFVKVPVAVKNETLFSLLNRNILLEKKVYFEMIGVADVIVSTAMGNITISGIEFSQSTSVDGLNGLSDPPISVSSSTLSKADAETIQLDLVLMMANPSPIAYHTVILPTQIGFGSKIFGNNSVSPFNLPRLSSNNYTTTGFLVKGDNATNAAIDKFISLHAQGQNVVLNVTGEPDKINITVQKQALRDLNTTASLAGSNIPLLAYVEMELDIPKILEGKIPTSLTLANPWTIQYQILKINQRVFLQDRFIAQLDEDISGNPITVLAGKTTVSPPQLATIEHITLAELKALVGTIYLSMNGTMDISIGDGFTTSLTYSQENIPASFWGSR